MEAQIHQPDATVEDETDGVKIANEDALSLARALLQSIYMLATNQRPPRKQAASYLWFTGKDDFDGESIFIHLDERIADFCNRGGFQMRIKS